MKPLHAGGSRKRRDLPLPPPCTHSMYVVRSYIGHANCLEHAFVRTRTSERTSSLPSLLLPSLSPHPGFFSFFLPPSSFSSLPPLCTASGINCIIMRADEEEIQGRSVGRREQEEEGREGKKDDKARQQGARMRERKKPRDGNGGEREGGGGGTATVFVSR